MRGLPEALLLGEVQFAIGPDEHTRPVEHQCRVMTAPCLRILNDCAADDDGAPAGGSASSFWTTLLAGDQTLSGSSGNTARSAPRDRACFNTSRRSLALRSRKTILIKATFSCMQIPC